MATATVLFCRVEHLVPSTIECVLCCLEPLFLLLQTSCCGDEPFLLQLPFRGDAFVVIRTVFFSGDGFIGLSLGVAIFGQRLRTLFVVRWLTLLYHWVNLASCYAVIAVFAKAGFRAAPSAPF